MSQGEKRGWAGREKPYRKTLAKELHNGNGNEEPARLCEMAVEWVLNNPNPIALKQPGYKR